MPTITHENVDALNAVLTINLDKSDYESKVNKKLKEYRKNVQLKGFRQGNVPMGLIKRKFGNNVLFEEINGVINENMTEYFKAENLKIIGQPLALENNDVNLNINKLSSYEFKFELGIAPAFELNGVSEDNQLAFYNIAVDAEEINAEVEQIRKRFGAGFEEGVTEITADDMISIDLVELDGDAPKVGGVTKENVFLALRDVANEELREKILSAAIGDSFVFDIYTIENKSKEHIRKYVLGLTPRQAIGEQFQLTIREVKRVKKAELTPELFKQIFPNEEIETEEAFNEKIKSEIYQGFKQSAHQYFSNLVHDHLLEQNGLELPVEFLRKWVGSTQKVEEGYFEGEQFQQFLKHLRWQLIREKISDKYEIEVKYEDVENMVRGEVLRYFNFQIPPYGEMMDNMIKRVLSDENEVQRRFEMILDEKVLERSSEDMGKDIKEVSKAEFEAIVKEYNDSKK